MLGLHYYQLSILQIFSVSKNLIKEGASELDTQFE